MSGVRFPSLRVANQLLPKRGLFLGFRESYHLSGIALGVSHVSLSLSSLFSFSLLFPSLSLSEIQSSNSHSLQPFL